MVDFSSLAFLQIWLLLYTSGVGPIVDGNGINQGVWYPKTTGAAGSFFKFGVLGDPNVGRARWCFSRGQAQAAKDCLAALLLVWPSAMLARWSSCSFWMSLTSSINLKLATDKGMTMDSCWCAGFHHGKEFGADSCFHEGGVSWQCSRQ